MVSVLECRMEGFCIRFHIGWLRPHERRLDDIAAGKIAELDMVSKEEIKR